MKDIKRPPLFCKKGSEKRKTSRDWTSLAGLIRTATVLCQCRTSQGRAEKPLLGALTALRRVDVDVGGGARQRM